MVTGFCTAYKKILYTNMAEIRMVVGLGNPGSEYVGTRHNIGFEVIDSLAEILDTKVKKRKFGARFGECEFSGKKLILLKPWQFMNCSGQAVVTAAGFYKLQMNDLLVISDDMTLEAGKIRLRRQGSAGGQKGLADIIEKCGTESISRLRIGIGKDVKIDAYDYVLGRPTKTDRQLLDKAVECAKQAAFCWLENGIETAMNNFNE